MHLSDADKAIASDCIKVLYEIGALEPTLIASYVDDFVKLLHSRNNRLVWGAMTALGAIASLRAADIFRQVETITEATQHGSAITQDWGVRVLATVSAQDAVYAVRIFPFLLTFLRRCPPKDLPRHAESVLDAGTLDEGNRGALLDVLEARKAEGTLKAAQSKRIEQMIRKLTTTTTR
jgi:hypothetical protein